MAPELPSWVIWAQALALPVSVVAAIAFGLANYALSNKKRNDEMFWKGVDLKMDIINELNSCDRENRRISQSAYDSILIGAKYIYGDGLAIQLAEIFDLGLPADGQRKMGRITSKIDQRLEALRSK